MSANRPPKRRKTSLTDKRLARIVISRAEMHDVRLVQASVENKLPSDKKPKNVKMELESQCSILQMKDSSHRLNINIRFRVLALAEAGNESESATFDFTFVLVYLLSSAENISEDNLHAFTKWIGFNNAWPYAREFLHSNTCRMGLPHLRLPLYKPEDVDDIEVGK